MDRFILDLRAIERTVSSPMPLSFVGYLPRHVPNPAPITHPTFDFTFCLSAPAPLESSYRAASRTIGPVRAPYFLYTSPFDVYEALSGKESPRELFYFAYGKSLAKRFEFFEASPENRLFEIDPLRFAPFVDKALELCQSLHAYGNVDRLDRLCEALACEAELFRKGGDASAKGVEGAVRAIASHVEMRFREPIDFQALFRRHGVSKRSFLRHWGRLFKEPPGKMIERLKAEEACRLLAESGLSVRETASRLGFSDPYYFSRFFRQRKGVAPSAYKAARKAE